jgi:uncharacterized membrane protein
MGSGVSGMERRLLAVSIFALAIGLVFSAAAGAAGRADPREAAKPAGASELTGIYLSTQYPALTVRAGETATIDLTLHNYRLPPQQLSLSVPQAASGWKATILGGGQPVSAAMVGPDSGELRLPITLTIGQELPAKLKLSTNFPALRGTATTAFKFTVTVANDSGRDATINFTADAPKNFQVTFTEAYGSQQITSIPIGVGKSKDIDASVALPRDTPAGDYKLVMHAKSDAASADLPLGITIFGQPRLSLSGEGGRLSGEAYAGKASPLTVVVRNDGTEAARDIELGANAPDGWKTSFDPKDVAILGAGKSQSVQVTFTPSERAIAGDYQATIRADAADGQSQSADFRITVLTSTLWGMAGIGVIAVALLVVVFAVARYGRR